MLDKKYLTKMFEYKFDKIYILHLLEYEDRLPALMAELDRVGISDCHNVEWFYDVRTPYDEKFTDCLVDVNDGTSKLTGIKKLTINHYKIWKQSYLLNYDRILILEDDIRFLESLDDLYIILSSHYEDIDLCLFDKCIWFDPNFKEQSFSTGIAAKNWRDYLKNNGYADFYIGSFNKLSSSSCYMLSNKGMKNAVYLFESLYEKGTAIANGEDTVYNERLNKKINFAASDNLLMGELYHNMNLNIITGFSVYNMCIQNSLYNLGHYFDLLFVVKYKLYNDDIVGASSELFLT